VPGPETLSATLWTANVDIAHACLQHPFVRGLSDGTLPITSFREYIAQDAYFLEAFARAYAYALAGSPDRHGLEAFNKLIAGVLDELTLHASYAERWQVNLAQVEALPATLAYTDFLLTTAATSSVGEICAAMTPCMRLYAYLGQTLSAERISLARNPYREWVETYASADFQALAGTLEALLDRYAEDTPPIRAAYTRAMQLELGFFETFTP
jgi:thiaminase (transcriptional activator TenA)